MLYAMMVPESIQPIGLYFFNVILVSLPAHYLLIITSAIFRAHRKVWVPLCSIIIAFGVNVVGDFGFGLGYFGLPKMGYAGIAWSTFFSVSAAALFNIIMLIKFKLIGRKSFVRWRWIKAGSPYLIRISIPTFMMQIFWNLGYVILYMVTATLPYDSINAVAGLTAGLNIESILFLPGAAFSMTASIVVGNLLGAGKREEAKKAAMRVLKIGCISMSSVAVLVWFLAPSITSTVASDAEVARHALTYLRFNICSTPFTMFSLILNGTMVGAGATKYNFFVNSASTWFVRLPLAYLLGHILWQNSSGVYFSMLVSQVFLSSTLFYIFKCRNWTRFSMVRS